MGRLLSNMTGIAKGANQYDTKAQEESRIGVQDRAALEALREQQTLLELGQRFQVYPDCSAQSEKVTSDKPHSSGPGIYSIATRILDPRSRRG